MKPGYGLAAALLWVSPAWAGEPARWVPPEKVGDYWLTDRQLEPAPVARAARNGIEACYIVEFNIDDTGRVHDARVLHKDASLKRRSWFGMKRGEVAKAKAATFRMQEQAVVQAVEAVTYTPAPSCWWRVSKGRPPAGPAVPTGRGQVAGTIGSTGPAYARPGLRQGDPGPIRADACRHGRLTPQRYNSRFPSPAGLLS